MPINIFFCYSRRDETLLNKLKAHLQPLQHQKLINMWHDHNISAGTEWKHTINASLNNAQIILLLISSDFMNSGYCYSIEMRRAIERHERGEARVIPIILRPVLWQSTPLYQLQALPSDGKPITDWHNQDKAFLSVAQGIDRVIKELPEQIITAGNRSQEESLVMGSSRKKRKRRKGSPVVTVDAKALPLPSSLPESAQLEQNTSSQITNVFHGQVQGAISGGTNTLNFNNTLLAAEDPIAKGRNDTKRGYNALKRRDYIAAKQYLEAADLTLSEDELPAEAAQVKYFLAIAFLNGRRPFNATQVVIQHAERLLRSAIALQALHSYYYALALLKRDFARNGLLQYKNDAQNLKRKAQHIKLTETDKENLQLLALCQPRLVTDAQRW